MQRTHPPKSRKIVRDRAAYVARAILDAMQRAITEGTVEPGLSVELIGGCGLIVKAEGDWSIQLGPLVVHDERRNFDVVFHHNLHYQPPPDPDNPHASTN